MKLMVFLKTNWQALNMQLCGKKITWICMYTCKACPRFNSRFYVCALARIYPAVRSRPRWENKKTWCASLFTQFKSFTENLSTKKGGAGKWLRRMNFFYLKK